MLFGKSLGRNQVIAIILSIGFRKLFTRKKISSATETLKKRALKDEEKIKAALLERKASPQEFKTASKTSLLGGKSCNVPGTYWILLKHVADYDRFAGPSISPWGDGVDNVKAVTDAIQDDFKDAWPAARALTVKWPQWVLDFMQVDQVDHISPSWPEALRDLIKLALAPPEPKKKGDSQTGSSGSSGSNGSNGSSPDPAAGKKKPDEKKRKAETETQPKPKRARHTREKRVCSDESVAPPIDSTAAGHSEAENEAADTLILLVGQNPDSFTAELQALGESSGAHGIDTVPRRMPVSPVPAAPGHEHLDTPAIKRNALYRPNTFPRDAAAISPQSPTRVTGRLALSNMLVDGMAGPIDDSDSPLTSPDSMRSADHAPGSSQRLAPPPFFRYYRPEGSRPQHPPVASSGRLGDSDTAPYRHALQPSAIPRSVGHTAWGQVSPDVTSGTPKIKLFFRTSKSKQ